MTHLGAAVTYYSHCWLVLYLFNDDFSAAYVVQ